MKPTPKTLVLAVVALLLLALNLIDQGTSARLNERLPQIVALQKDAVRRIEISTAVDKTVIESVATEAEAGVDAGRRWKITAPIQADADQVAVQALLANFRKEVPLDVKVDLGNLDDYGLDAGTGIVVEIWTEADGAAPSLSLTVGQDAPGGSTFVRLSGDEAVYRARVGGRHRFDKSSVEWRNRVLLDFDKAFAIGILVESDGSVLSHLVRGPSPGVDADSLPLPGPWRLEPDPGYPTDALLADAIAQGLGLMRAGELMGADFDGGFTSPLAVITVTLADGTERVLEVGSRESGGARFVRVNGQPDVYRVAASTIDQALLPAQELRDKTLFAFERQAVDTLALKDGAGIVLLQQDLSNGLWNVIEPPNVDVDVKLVFFAVNTLATLRSDEIASGVSFAQAGLEDPSNRIVVHFLDGHDEVLDIGHRVADERGRTLYFARVGGKDTVHLLREATVVKLRQGFGRG